MIVGTAGHIDHGKTALVKALTGVDADRLREEKARGMTIDLGYAYSSLADGEVLGFIDVPGHEKFIHNMLAGATGIGFALLVIAADDGPMPQTREHLQILDLLGIERGAVALTKCDRVDGARRAEAALSIEKLLQGTGLAGSPIFAVSSLSGEGIAELRAYLEASAAGVNATAHGGGFRLAVDRCFTVAGVGTVVTGTVFSGRVEVGQQLMVSPSGLPVRVRGLHAQNRPAEFAAFGQRCALNLAGAEKREILRGDWVIAPELHLPTQRLDIEIKLSPWETKPLRHWTPALAHLGAFHSAGRIALLTAEPIQPGDTALAQLVLDKRTIASWGDHCILRDVSAQRTLGGGRVLDAQPPIRGRRTPQRLGVLAAWGRRESDQVLHCLVEASPNGVDLTSFAVNANLIRAAADAMCQRAGLIRVDGARPRAFSAAQWESLRQRVVQALQQEHENHPDSLGLNAEQLRLRVAPSIARDIFKGLLSELREEKRCALDGSWWHLPGHRILLTSEEEALWSRINPLLTENPFQPPRVRDIARREWIEEDSVRVHLIRISRLGRAYKVAHDHYFHWAAVAELANIVRQLCSEAPDGEVHAAGFRNRIGTGRKLAIQILEFFDHIGLTRRVKDAHRLRDDGLTF